MLQYTYIMYMRKTLLSLILLLSMGTVSIVFADTMNIVNTQVYKDIKLKAPIYKQQYANSCEAAALRMALAFKGVMKNDVQILTKFGYNPTYKDWANNIWDDPQKQYVGFVDVTGRIKGGYGVYGLPVVKAIESFKLNAEYATSTAITPTFIAQAVDNKNPVMIWGYTSFTEAPYTWQTPEGNTVKAFKGEHVRLVVGFKGTIEKPVGFYIHDSVTGKAFEYWTTEQLVTHMNKVPGVTDQAVIVK